MGPRVPGKQKHMCRLSGWLHPLLTHVAHSRTRKPLVRVGTGAMENTVDEVRVPANPDHHTIELVVAGT
jgi:hypothetical protein